MRDHPAHFFIVYLLTRGTKDAQDDAVVAAMVQSHGSFVVDAPLIRELRREVLEDQPTSFHPTNKNHRESMRYLRRQRVHSMHFPNRHVNLMQEQILLAPKTRFAVERLLIGRCTPEFVSSRLNANFHTLLTTRAVEIYRHYFFNTELMDLSDWTHYLVGQSDYHNMLAIAQVGAPLAVFRTGLRQVIDSKQMIKDAQRMAYMTLLEVNERHLSNDKVRMINTLAKVLLATDERLSQSDMALGEVLKQFERFQLRQKKIGPSGITQLAPDGQYTESGRVKALKDIVGDGDVIDAEFETRKVGSKDKE